VPSILCTADIWELKNRSKDLAQMAGADANRAVQRQRILRIGPDLASRTSHPHRKAVMTPAQRNDFQLRAVVIAYRHRSPSMGAAALERLRSRSEAILDAMPVSPDTAFRNRLRLFRHELRPIN